MKKKTLSFIKKYPLSIFLGVIVINLLYISFHLRDYSKLAFYKETCSRYFAFYANGTDQQAKESEIITAKKIKVPLEFVDAFCQQILRA